MKELIELLQAKLEYYERINSQATRNSARNHQEGGLRVIKSHGSFQYYKCLIKPYEISDDEYVKQWENISYEGKPFEPNLPEIYSEQGERVRSKSEKMIADKLNMLGIPYRYEYPVRLQGCGTVYPDFLFLNRATRKEYIYEHFGMMDNPDYANNTIKKINLYAKNGYVLGKNLLVSWETSHAPWI